MSKVWLVTGAGRGLGREIVKAALAAGDSVLATARRPEQLDDVRAEFPAALRVASADVTDVAAVEAAVKAAVDGFGRLDVVVNNAGYADLAAVEDATLAAFREQMDANFIGTVAVTQAALPVLRGQDSGHVINVSSVGGRVGIPGLAAYQAAKWAVNGFTEVLAKEVGPLGIRVTAVEPGGMETDWAGSSMAIPEISEPYRETVGALAGFFRAAPLRPAGDPAKVAAAILEVAAMDDPPVRLLLGSDAIVGARAAARNLAATDLRMEKLTRSTDRPDATAVELDPLGESAREPLALVTRFIEEVINQGHLEVLDELWAEDLAWHGGSLGDIHGLDAYREMLEGSASGAFTGMRLEVDDVVAAGDKVAVRFTNGGTQTGPFMGFPATDREARWLGIGIYQVSEGRIQEAWFGEDILGMLLELGAVNLPAA
ncbi:MAG TPA: SDR family NAD(P)-dependent oxidoreductase [Solirubrobacterales bacterium]